MSICLVPNLVGLLKAHWACSVDGTSSDILGHGAVQQGAVHPAAECRLLQRARSVEAELSPCSLHARRWASVLHTNINALWKCGLCFSGCCCCVSWKPDLAAKAVGFITLQQHQCCVEVWLVHQCLLLLCVEVWLVHQCLLLLCVLLLGAEK